MIFRQNRWISGTVVYSWAAIVNIWIFVMSVSLLRGLWMDRLCKLKYGFCNVTNNWSKDPLCQGDLKSALFNAMEFLNCGGKHKRERTLPQISCDFGELKSMLGVCCFSVQDQRSPIRTSCRNDFISGRTWRISYSPDRKRLQKLNLRAFSVEMGWATIAQKYRAVGRRKHSSCLDLMHPPIRSIVLL